MVTRKHKQSSNEAGTSRSPSIPVIPPARPIPLASFLNPFRSSTSQWLLLPVMLMVVFLLRWVVGLGPYSGMAAPPMHGDFEAQRHWIELTSHVPLTEWYWHDLEWWGLDYPPLTAYHSWILGKFGSWVDPSWFELRNSRRLDDNLLKVFMRASVVISEFVTFVPAVVIFVGVCGRRTSLSAYDRAIALGALLLHPGLILIDHGHFQYNSVMFGLTLYALDCFMTDHLLWGSFFFVLSISFKQMALYYAPAIFAYLLGSCVFPIVDTKRLVKIGVIVMVTFALILGPFVFLGGTVQLEQCLRRVFPFARGLWEDKVANFWCAANVVIKFRERFTTSFLQSASLLATLVGILPTCLVLFLYPRKSLLPIGMTSCAWGFFLFSFQVHEKSVLLPLITCTSLLALSREQDDLVWITWMNNIATFSLWPLLKKDGLVLQYSVVMVLYAWLMGTFNSLPGHWMGKVVHVGSYAAIIGLHLGELAIEKIGRYPDFWVVLNVLFCFSAFVVAWGWTMWKLWRELRRKEKKV